MPRKTKEEYESLCKSVRLFESFMVIQDSTDEELVALAIHLVDILVDCLINCTDERDEGESQTRIGFVHIPQSSRRAAIPGIIQHMPSDAATCISYLHQRPAFADPVIDKPFHAPSVTAGPKESHQVPCPGLPPTSALHSASALMDF